MRVLFVCSGNNGINPIVQAQAKSLREAGLQLEIAPIIGKGVWGYIRSLPRIRKHIKQFAPEIIHCHYSFCGILASFATRKPVITSMMGSDVKSSELWRFIIRFYVWKAWNATIVKSTDMKQSLGLNSPIVIPNGVSFNAFKELSPTKCKHELGWDPEFKYVLFGADPARDVKNYPLAKQSYKLMHNNNCNLVSLGAIPHDDVPKFLNACDVLLLTSKWEGSPNIVKEAMACGTPIVCTDVGDVQWLLSDLEGCFITSQAPEDIASQLNNALQFERKTKGRQRLIELGLDSESVAKRIVEVYERVLSSE